MRKRGVRASREKLSQALADAGLRTQNALAERIADIEDLDSPPRDLVNRVFREKPVDPLSLERVARALGVKAHTLYLSSADLPPDTGRSSAAADEVAAPRKRRIVTPLRAFGGACLILIVAAAVIWNLPEDTPLGCSVSEMLHPPQATKGRLGIMIARFVNDPDNAAQFFLANNFIADPRLDPYVSVLTTCRTLSLNSPGDVGLQRSIVRERGRQLLQESGARVLLWGRVEGNRLEVRFISTRQGHTSVTVEIGGRPIAIEEKRLQIPLLLSQSADSLPDIKMAALQLMSLQTPAQAKLRARAMHSYSTSIDWLRASIVGDENLRRSIDPRLNPRRWATINSELCYNYRLLGEYDASAKELRSAEAACKNVLEVRPRAQFPLQWAQTEINLASVYVRLHVFADNREDSVKLLRKAEASLKAVDAAIKRPLAPQMWAIVQRNLGIVYVRLGELATGKKSEQLFERAIALTQASLEAQNPAFQPLDWAVTQQNICLALHDLGTRRGKAGIEFVRKAIDHCREALRWLSPQQSALDWAMAQNNLAVSEAILAQMQSDKSNLTRAIAAFKKTQTVYTEQDLPMNWAMIETNLGELYCHLARIGSEGAAFEPALVHTGHALQVFTARKITRYRQYVERQLEAIEACRAGDTARCGCSGS
ncbi:MAG: hypothetical protein L0I62_06635 [Gammaproteobacteria bacterium]|nr:hypothetical protein [Gammaproteobacteria bacterium]